MITANRQVTYDVEQFVYMPVPGVLSLGRGLTHCLSSHCGIVPKSGEKRKILYTFL